MDKEIDNRVNSAIFQKKIEIAPDTFEVYFKLEKEFDYTAGQYAWLQLPNMKYEDLKGDRRAFSIINPKNKEGIVSFLFRRGQSNFKKSVLELIEGEKVNIIGPFGSSFNIPENKDANLILLSAGVGIAPFMNILRNITEQKINRKIHLLSFQRDGENLYEEELKQIKNKKFKYKIYYNEKITSTHLKDIKEEGSLYYISGPQSFIDETHSILKEKGVSDLHMRFENFYPHDEHCKNLDELLKKELHAEYNNGGILLSAIRSSSHHVLITDKNGIIIFANEAAQKITGFTFAEMEGNTPRLWGGLMSHEFYKKLWHSKMSGHVVDAEVVNRRKNGETYHVIGHISSIKDREGFILGFIATEEDITHIRKQERKILLAKEELERSTLLMADRELKMIELKKEIEELKKSANDRRE